jgi:deoxycytidine triphosphate deaminase
MAKILPDRDIKRLIGCVLVEADAGLINPNGIELRLGKDVHFHSTGEEMQLEPDHFLRVNAGETVSISSIETIDFTAKSVQGLFPNKMLMGLITPTTTMMREGISQVATKIDAGFRGNLNWGLRNGSIKELILRYGEPIFKLTVFVLDEDESPDLAYGERSRDSYQDATGIARSARSIPADIPKSKILSSSLDRIDPKKQLREAGYPFDHIGTELTTLHGKFEVVSTDMRMMKEEFSRRTTELSDKIASETSALSVKIQETRESLLEKVEALFDRKFSVVAGVIIGAIPLVYGAVNYLQGTGLRGNTVAFIAMICGALIILGTYLLTRRTK